MNQNYSNQQFIPNFNSAQLLGQTLHNYNFATGAGVRSQWARVRQ